MGDNLPAVDLGAGKTAVAISAGGSCTCAILDDGKVKCWGNLNTIELGTGKTAVAIAVAGSHVCAILNDGSIKCWGHNDYGQLGLGDTKSRDAFPSEMGDNLPAVDLGAGMKALAIGGHLEFTCALLEGGGLKCWGRNDAGQLGLGDTVHRGDEPGEMGDNLPFVAP
jgi:alpha-tubulin suppressor-like RCC1 family protein